MKVGTHLSKKEIEEENLLVEQSKKDPNIFGGLYDKYFESIFSFVLRRTENENIADDISSNVFYKALINIRKYNYQGVPFSAWLFRIAINEINSYYSRQKRKKLFNFEEYEIRKYLSQDSEEFEILYQKVKTVLQDMPTEIIEIIEMRFFEDLSFKEISYILSISESGAKMRTYRAIEKIKQIIQSESNKNE